VTSSDIPTSDSTDAETERCVPDATADPNVTVGGQPFRCRALVYAESIWATAHMHLLRRAPYLATREDLLQSGEWGSDPRKWHFRLARMILAVVVGMIFLALGQKKTRLHGQQGD
jgi:hypothetical protein